jgi:hypothetical protein
VKGSDARRSEAPAVIHPPLCVSARRAHHRVTSSLPAHAGFASYYYVAAASGRLADAGG